MSRGITQLRRSLLPARFSDTGIYRESVHRRTAAFRVLAHAEFESYLEDAVLECLDSAHQAWKLSGTPSNVLTALLAYDEVAGKPPSSILDPPQKISPTLERRIEQAKARFSRRVTNQNHGIKEDNILSLVCPIGVREGNLDQEWLKELEAWATRRGDYAHKSLLKVGTADDPKRVLEQVRRLQRGFQDLDVLIFST